MPTMLLKKQWAQLLLEVLSSSQHTTCQHWDSEHVHLTFLLLSASIILVHSNHREKSPRLLLTQHLLSLPLLNPLKGWYCASIFFPCHLSLHLAFSSELINPIMFFTLNKNGIYRIQSIRHWTGTVETQALVPGLRWSYSAVISPSHS